jgi:FMN-dependent NADH-azoreductase
MQILQINTSARMQGAHSRDLTQSIVAQLLQQQGDAQVVQRDLGLEPLPHISEATIQAFYQDESTYNAAMQASSALSMTLIDELRQSDVIVFGVPMYNFGIPSTLKAYIDHVARAGQTFEFTESGPQGLLKGKKVLVAITRGGGYIGSPQNHQDTYLKTVLAFLGIDDVTFVIAENLAIPDQAEPSLLEAQQRIGALQI